MALQRCDTLRVHQLGVEGWLWMAKIAKMRFPGWSCVKCNFVQFVVLQKSTFLVRNANSLEPLFFGPDLEG